MPIEMAVESDCFSTSKRLAQARRISARHADDEPVRREHAPRLRLQVGKLQRLEVRQVPDRQPPVGMVAVHQLVERFLAQVLVVTLAQPLLHVVDGRLAQALELGRIPARVQHHVGEDGEQLGEVVLVDPRVEGGLLLVDAHVQLGRQREERVDQRLGVEGLGATLGHHARREIREAGLAGRIVDGPASEAKLDVDDVLLGHRQLDQAQAGGSARDRRR
jgi:hypothetical protein